MRLPLPPTSSSILALDASERKLIYNVWSMRIRSTDTHLFVLKVIGMSKLSLCVFICFINFK
jgi:hypothetical protein